MKTIRVVAVMMFLVAGGGALHVVQAQQAGAKRTELQRHELSIPGREVIQVRVDLEPGYAFPSHTHPGEEIIYVIEDAIRVSNSVTSSLRDTRKGRHHAFQFQSVD